MKRVSSKDFVSQDISSLACRVPFTKKRQRRLHDGDDPEHGCLEHRAHHVEECDAVAYKLAVSFSMRVQAAKRGGRTSNLMVEHCGKVGGTAKTCFRSDLVNTQRRLLEEKVLRKRNPPS
jgi:hypothetical protein